MICAIPVSSSAACIIRATCSLAPPWRGPLKAPIAAVIAAYISASVEVTTLAANVEAFSSCSACKIRHSSNIFRSGPAESFQRLSYDCKIARLLPEAGRSAAWPDSLIDRFYPRRGCNQTLPKPIPPFLKSSSPGRYRRILLSNFQSVFRDAFRPRRVAKKFQVRSGSAVFRIKANKPFLQKLNILQDRGYRSRDIKVVLFRRL